MELILAWVLFPLVLGAIGLGWGVVAERASGARVKDALLIPLGLAATLVLTGTLAAFSATARAATPVVAVGAAAGLVLAWRGQRGPGRWPLLAAVGVLLVYGAPVLLSGQATFTGFLKLDDTSYWFNVIDHVLTHGRSLAGEPASTYRLIYESDIGPTYPLGAFMLPAVARALVGVDIAWVFQPYLACCAAALALCVYALIEPLIGSARVRALVAFVGAQSALLYGYSLWGGIKELTAALPLALMAALAAAAFKRRPARWRELIPLAVAAGALIQTLGVGAGGWVAPALGLVVLAWFWQGWRAADTPSRRLRAPAISTAWLAGLTAACAVPVWVVLSKLNESGLFSSGQSQHTKFGNLYHSLSVFQLAGIWPVRDFRLTAPTLPSALLIGLALLAAAAAVWLSVRRRHFGVALYVAVALIGCGLTYFAGGTPWVVGKTLAFSSPALLVAAMTGGGLLWSLRRRHRAAAPAGAVLMAVLLGGVLWSNVLGYGDVTLAPRARLAELQHIGSLLAGKGPTFLNQFEGYGDRHFLRAGAPVAPAEYRTVTLPLRDGLHLTAFATADLDSFPLSTLEPYRSIVTPRSPAESRPPSIYRLVWQGAYYQLWQRPAHPSTRILEQVPLGESNALPYCGPAQDGPAKSLCSDDPVATPPCAEIHSLARQAATDHADLVAYQRAAPVVARGDETLWPGTWIHDVAAHLLIATTPGVAVAHIALDSDQSYELWLGGSFARGFHVTVDGRSVGQVKDQIFSTDPTGGYVHVTNLYLTAGVHELTFTYPESNLTPGSAENEFTALAEIVLQPRQSPVSEMLTVSPQHASQLCGRPLDWIELAVAG